MDVFSHRLLAAGLFSFFIATLVGGVIGCGGEGDDFFSDDETEVTAVAIEDEVLRVGEATILGVYFDYSNQDVADGDNVVVAIKLPPELSYREGTAEIEGGSLGDDESVGAQVTTCESGETFLVFDMDEFDLDEADDPGRGAEALLKLTVDATEEADSALISARARQSSLSYSCTSPFLGDDDELVSILP